MVRDVGFSAHHSGSGPRIKYGTGSGGMREGRKGVRGQGPDSSRGNRYDGVKEGLEEYFCEGFC